MLTADPLRHKENLESQNPARLLDLAMQDAMGMKVVHSPDDENAIAVHHLPIPVIARNVDLLRRFTLWSQAAEAKDDRLSKLRFNGQKFIKDVKCDLYFLLAFLEEQCLNPHDFPLFTQADSNEQYLRSLITASALMFWSREHLLLELTPSMQTILNVSDLGEDLTCSMIPKLPQAMFIRFGSQIHIDPLVPMSNGLVSKIQGVYLFNREGYYSQEGAKSLIVIPISQMYLDNKWIGWGINHIELPMLDPQYSLTQAITNQCNAKYADHLMSVLKAVVKTLLCYSLPEIDRTFELSYTETSKHLVRVSDRKSGKVAKRLTRLYDRVVMGPAHLVTHGHGELSPHLRRGHFRNQTYGPQSKLRKLIFIQPHWIRADKLKSDKR